ncbi:unnamed protein product [Closterium sp. NIES-54]
MRDYALYTTVGAVEICRTSAYSHTGGARTGGTGAARPAGAPGAGAGGASGVGATGGPGAVATMSAGGPAGAGAAGGSGASGAAGVGAGSGGAARPYFVPLPEQLASPLPAPSPYAGPTGGLAEHRKPESRPASPVRAACTSRRVPRPRPPAVRGTHQMALRPSTAPQRVPLPSPPASSLPALADPACDSLCATSPTVTRLLATVVTDPFLESTAASALVTELVDFAAHCRLDFATSLVAESASVSPPSVGGECALSTDVLEDRQEEFQCFVAALPHLVSMLLAPEGDPDAPDILTPRSYAEAIEGPYSSQWQAAMDAEMASWKSTGTYVDEVPPPGANIVSGMWIFRVKRPPGSPPVFKARYVARGFSQRQGVDYFHTFSPTPKMTTLRVLLHVAAQRDYELHPLDFSTAFLQGSLHEEIWLRRPPGFTGSFPPGTQTTLAALGFAPSTADPSLFLRTDTSLPLFYILVYVDDLVFATADTAGLAHVKSELQKRHTCTDLGELRSYLRLQITRDRARRTITLTQSHMVQRVLQRFDFKYSLPQATPLSTRHSLSALPSDESVEPSGPYPELVGCLMYLMTCTRPDLAYPLSILARYVAPRRHQPEHMAAAKMVLRYLCSTSGLGLVLGGRSPVVLTGHADASWVDDLATQWSSQGYTFSLGELPSSPPVLYIDNKAMLALCREHRLEHRTKHIALRYFLARELQQRGQLRLAYVASQANTADIFTKALQPCDHQRFCIMLAPLRQYHGKGGLYIGKAVLKNNVFVLDFVPDLGTADSDGIVTFTSWTHPLDLDPDFSPEGFWYSHTIPEAERTRALATIQHSAAAETTSAAAETTAAAAETTAVAAAPSTPITGPSTASAQIDDTPPTPAQQLNPTPREVHRSANFTASFYSNSDLYRRSPGHRAGEDIWHTRMGHPSNTVLNNTIRAGVLDKDSVFLTDGSELRRARGTCFTYPEADLSHRPFASHHNPSAPAYTPLEKVYSDILYNRELGQGAYSYTITFIDAATRYVWHLNLPSKDMAFEAFVAWLPVAE